MQEKARRKQKLKILYLYQILLENTDENHAITGQEILDKLHANDVTAERKSLYDDIAQLRDFGVEIKMTQKNKTYYYQLENRTFSLSEVKLLVDTVQAARFISADKSTELIKKLETLTCRQTAQQLQRQVYVAGRVKTMNDEILENVDHIHNAIAQDRAVDFQYMQWNMKKELEVKKEGAIYHISPWGLCWAGENYYMIGYDEKADKIKHYRVDKMHRVSASGEKRKGRKAFKAENMAEYSKRLFGMYGGVERLVKLLCRNDKANVIIDRFGKDIPIVKNGPDTFTATVRVEVSDQFLGWVMGLGDQVTIVGPEDVVDLMKNKIVQMSRQYGWDT